MNLRYVPETESVLQQGNFIFVKRTSLFTRKSSDLKKGNSKGLFKVRVSTDLLLCPNHISDNGRRVSYLHVNSHQCLHCPSYFVLLRWLHTCETNVPRPTTPQIPCFLQQIALKTMSSMTLLTHHHRQWPSHKQVQWGILHYEKWLLQVFPKPMFISIRKSTYYLSFKYEIQSMVFAHNNENFLNCRVKDLYSNKKVFRYVLLQSV